MIKSMTGFASLTKDDDVATIAVTIRSVNHKFLDLQVRLPTVLAAIESRLGIRIDPRHRVNSGAAGRNSTVFSSRS